MWAWLDWVTLIDKESFSRFFQDFGFLAESISARLAAKSIVLTTASQLR
jgi:hypothetical protein